MENTFCPFCGSINKQGEVFCLNCGAKLIDSDSQKSSTQMPINIQTNTSQTIYPTHQNSQAVSTYNITQPYKQQNIAASVSIIFAILGLIVLPVIGSLIAIISGFIGLANSFDRSKALLGLALGIFEVILYSVLVWWIVYL